MWCAGANATVREYTDGAGADHKIITFKAQPGLTPEMALFYQAGSFPQNINLLGKKVRARVRVLRGEEGLFFCGAARVSLLPELLPRSSPRATPTPPLTKTHPLSPPHTHARAQNFFWYHLWHPIDHIMSENR